MFYLKSNDLWVNRSLVSEIRHEVDENDQNNYFIVMNNGNVYQVDRMDAAILASTI